MQLLTVAVVFGLLLGDVDGGRYIPHCLTFNHGVCQTPLPVDRVKRFGGNTASTGIDFNEDHSLLIPKLVERCATSCRGWKFDSGKTGGGFIVYTIVGGWFGRCDCEATSPLGCTKRDYNGWNRYDFDEGCTTAPTTWPTTAPTTAPTTPAAPTVATTTKPPVTTPTTTLKLAVSPSSRLSPF